MSIIDELRKRPDWDTKKEEHEEIGYLVRSLEHRAANIIEVLLGKGEELKDEVKKLKSELHKEEKLFEAMQFEIETVTKERDQYLAIILQIQALSSGVEEERPRCR